MPFAVTAKMTLDAMVADAYAMSYRERHGLGPPSPLLGCHAVGTYATRFAMLAGMTREATSG